MTHVVWSFGLLAFSSYLWPSLYKRSSTVGELLVYLAIGGMAAIGLGVLARRIDRSNAAAARPAPSGIPFLTLLAWCVPIATLQTAFGIAYWSNIGSGRMHLGALSTLPFTFVLFWAVVDASIRGLCEETVFRGMLQPALKRKFAHHDNPTVSAIGVTTLCFVIAHIYGVYELWLLPYLAVISIWYGYLSATTGSFAGAAILHVMHNIGAALVAYSGVYRLGEYAGIVWMLALLFATSFAIVVFAKQWPLRH